jgi:hypothetical protein
MKPLHFTTERSEITITALPKMLEVGPYEAQRGWDILARELGSQLIDGYGHLIKNIIELERLGYIQMDIRRIIHLRVTDSDGTLRHLLRPMSMESLRVV